MDTTWSATDVIEATTTGTIGMYGTGGVYYFYCYFQADNYDRWYSNSSGATKDFILLFQMGNLTSDWTGVHLAIATGTTVSAETDFSQIGVTNDVKTAG